MTVKLLFFGDLHLADKPPAGRVDDYFVTGMRKLGVIGEICERERINCAFQSGDWFHLKQPSRVSHHLVQEVLSICKSFPCPIWAIKGNHDMASDGTIERQPLRVLQEAEGVRILPDRPVRWDWEEAFWIVPRHYSASAEGLFSGKADPRYYTISAQERRYIDQRPAPIIGLSHGSLLAPGDSRPYPYVNVDQIPDFHLYDLFVSGHLHECLGVIQVGKTIFANPGSISRVARTQSNYIRTVEVLVVTISGKELTVKEVPIPGVKPATEVFGKKEQPAVQVEQSDSLDRFIEAAKSGLMVDELTISELLAGYDGLKPEVQKLVMRLLEEAEV